MDRSTTDGALRLGGCTGLYCSRSRLRLRRGIDPAVSRDGHSRRPTAPRSPWQNAYAERLIGSIRREMLDPVVVLGERYLRHLRLSYVIYHNEACALLSLDRDAPIPREVWSVGRIFAMPHLGRLNHQYVRV